MKQTGENGIKRKKKRVVKETDRRKKSLKNTFPLGSKGFRVSIIVGVWGIV